MTDEELNTIRASDLLKLMKVIEVATGLYNACERLYGSEWGLVEFHELGDALRELGLSEVERG